MQGGGSAFAGEGSHCRANRLKEMQCFERLVERGGWVSRWKGTAPEPRPSGAPGAVVITSLDGTRPVAPSGPGPGGSGPGWRPQRDQRLRCTNPSLVNALPKYASSRLRVPCIWHFLKGPAPSTLPDGRQIMGSSWPTLNPSRRETSSPPSRTACTSSSTIFLSVIRMAGPEMEMAATTLPV